MLLAIEELLITEWLSDPFWHILLCRMPVHYICCKSADSKRIPRLKFKEAPTNILAQFYTLAVVHAPANNALCTCAYFSDVKTVRAVVYCLHQLYSLQVVAQVKSIVRCGPLASKQVL